MSRDAEELYLPMPAAQEHGILNIREHVPGVPQDAARSVWCGVMPDEAGLVELADGTMAAFDLVQVSHASVQTLDIAPLPKSAVAGDTGRMLGRGSIVLSTRHTVKPIADVLPWRIAQWHDGFHQVGEMGLRHLGIEALQYEITSVHPSGLVRAEVPRRYF